MGVICMGYALQIVTFHNVQLRIIYHFLYFSNDSGKVYFVLLYISGNVTIYVVTLKEHTKI